MEQEAFNRRRTGKEIKVKIPVGYHVKLHTLKVIKGQSISDTVEIALKRYFERNPYPATGFEESILTRA